MPATARSYGEASSTISNSLREVSMAAIAQAAAAVPRSAGAGPMAGDRAAVLSVAAGP